MKFIIYISVSMYLIFSLYLNRGNAVTYFVKTNGNDSAAGTNWATAWKTIGKAATTMTNTDITYVSNGIYYEYDITFSGNGSGPNKKIIIQTVNPLKTAINSTNGTYCFDLHNKKYITISGFILKKAGTGIRILQSDYCIITNCKIIDNDRGIHILGASSFDDPATNNKVSHCFFSNNLLYEGIFLEDRERFNVIEYNTFINNYHGISWGHGWATPPLHNTIYSNYISHNNHRGINMYLAFVGGEIVGNSINSNGNVGIWLQEIGRTLMISNNKIIGNSGAGIDYYSSWGSVNLGDKKFYNNIIAHNGAHGVDMNISSGWEDANDTVFSGNTIFSNISYGIYITGDSDSAISNIICFSNKLYGNGSYNIYFQPYYKTGHIVNNNLSKSTYGLYISQADNIIVSSNKIYNNSHSGIYMNNANSSNIIRDNEVYSNNSYGLYIKGTPTDSSALNNQIYNNTNAGIYIYTLSADNFLVYSNTIYGSSQMAGISLSNSKSIIIMDNSILNNEQRGINCINSTNIDILTNNIFLNPQGIYFKNSYTKVIANNITNNNYGIVRNNGDFSIFTKNNLYPNNNFSFSNISGGAIHLTNSWWGSTIASSIQSNIYGLSGYSNFTPYRLFGPFKIYPGADIISPEAIQNLISNISEATVKLRWNKSSASDFIRYSVYRSDTPGTTNLTRNNVITNISDINQTNYNDFPGNGTWYYTVTALDSNPVYTNESWYSTVTNATVFLTTVISIIKSVSKVTLQNSDASVIPGATITYKIVYSNKGNFSGENTIIYDRVPNNVSFFTSMLDTATNWIFEYSTNENPDQNYNSSDYNVGFPVNKSNINWIRWKKQYVWKNEDGLSLVYKVIIK